MFTEAVMEVLLCKRIHDTGHRSGPNKQSMLWWNLWTELKSLIFRAGMPCQGNSASCQRLGF